ncbi:unnamed protein product [Caenorhabditis bovis]|uniref:VWA domain-containing protein n=1 Tax=Caenorhabditis bovis TaxID=2654633 RepID=A0A8S1EZE8_9PELO|nr:unnamed protein product [Caenorhabditis bovis]CAB3405473.1 unnamed protein product [Caenorhabditis bovis]
MNLLLLVFLVASATASNYITGRTTDWTDNDTSTQPNYPTSSPAPGRNTDRECACSLDNYWLDVVAVVDNSAGMTAEGLVQVAADISSLFGQSRVGSNYSDPRSVRLAIVTYNSQATISANLDYFQSTDQLMQYIFGTLTVSQNSLSYVSTGLGAAEKVLEVGRANGRRKNYKQVVIVYASDYREDGDHDPVPPANRLKESGVTVITVAFDQNGDESSIRKIGTLASPGNAFINTDMNLVGEIQGALCQANCFCPDLWVQYSTRFGDAAAYKYGVCLKDATIAASWTAAKFACQSLHPGGYLATEFDSQKHSFIFRISPSSTQSQPYMYHIGLHYINGRYQWEQPKNQALIPLSGYTNWNPGYPSNPTSTPCVLSQQAGSDVRTGWQNENCFTVTKNYVCEVASCDTDNYCS